MSKLTKEDLEARGVDQWLCRNSNLFLVLGLVLGGLLLLVWAGLSCPHIDIENPSAQSESRAPGATVKDIDIADLGSRVEGEYVFVTGRLINKSKYPAGVQIKITAYDRHGHILTVRDSWPASISNILGNSSFPFETMIDRLAGHDHIEASVIRVEQWD